MVDENNGIKGPLHDLAGALTGIHGLAWKYKKKCANGEKFEAEDLVIMMDKITYYSDLAIEHFRQLRANERQRHELQTLGPKAVATGPQVLVACFSRAASFKLKHEFEAHAFKCSTSGDIQDMVCKIKDERIDAVLIDFESGTCNLAELLPKLRSEDPAHHPAIIAVVSTKDQIAEVFAAGIDDAVLRSTPFQSIAYKVRAAIIESQMKQH